MIRDTFINGLMPNTIQQRLLECKIFDVQTAFDTARLIDVAQQSSTVYSQSTTHEINAFGESSTVAALT